VAIPDPDSGAAGGFPAALAAAARGSDAVLEAIIAAGGAEFAGGEPENAAGTRLWAAMRYALFAGGKRLRPFLVLSTSDLCAEDPAATRPHALRAAAALELVHCYSLVHDDLPAMDDDDLRRGQPTVHRRFDEATAILVGDALQALAFAVLADPATHPDPAVRAALVGGLARGAGAAGMVAGQALDLAAADIAAPQAGFVRRVQALKTGALIRFACEAGGRIAGADEAQISALRAYGDHLGALFQITDDLLDVEGDEAALGKAVGKDADQGKATFVALLGLDGARKEARERHRMALESLDLFGKKAELLRAAADFVLHRQA
jgi:farnesyl diphosphate synthase